MISIISLISYDFIDFAWNKSRIIQFLENRKAFGKIKKLTIFRKKLTVNLIDNICEGSVFCRNLKMSLANCAELETC